MHADLKVALLRVALQAMALACMVLTTTPSAASVPDDGSVDSPREARSPDRRAGSSDTRPLRAWNPDAAPTGDDDQARSWLIEPGVESEDVLLFLPRAVLFVPKLALHVAFLPLQGLVRGYEALKPGARLGSLFGSDGVEPPSHGPSGGGFGVSPALNYASDYGFSLGLTLAMDDLLGHDETAALSMAFFGRYDYAFQLRFAADRVAGTALWLDAAVRYEVSPGEIFEGIGQSAPAGTEAPAGLAPNARSRFEDTRTVVALRVGGSSGYDPVLAKLGASVTLEKHDFGAATRDHGDPSLGEQYDTAALTGFDDGSTTLEALGVFLLDTRRGGTLHEGGVYLHAFGGAGVPFEHGATYGKLGSEFAAWIPLWLAQRSLVLRAGVEALIADRKDVPFTHLATLGGEDHLRGYARGSFRDLAALHASVGYRFPVHAGLHLELFADWGRVADSADDLFDDLDAIKFAGGGTLTLESPKQVYLSLTLAYGANFYVAFTTDVFALFDDTRAPR